MAAKWEESVIALRAKWEDKQYSYLVEILFCCIEKKNLLFCYLNYLSHCLA